MNDHVDPNAHPTPGAVAAEIDRQLRALPEPSTTAMRDIRRAYSKRLRAYSATDILAVADALVESLRWVAYELLFYHPSKLSQLDADAVERLGRGLAGWEAVDTFGAHRR